MNQNASLKHIATPHMAVLSATLLALSACSTPNRIVKSDLYWQTLETRQLEPKEAITHWANLHTGKIEPLKSGGWANAQVEAGNIKVNFAKRCAGLVELPSEQRRDVQHVGGWHNDLALAALAGAAAGFVVGGIALANSGAGWDDDLAAGHPAIESYTSNGDIDTAMIAGMSTGGVMTLLAATGYLLNHIEGTEVMDTQSLYGLDSAPCDPNDEDTFALVPTVTKAELVDVGELKLGVQSLLIPSDGRGVEAKDIEGLFASPSTLNLSVDVAADVPGAGDQYAISQAISLDPDADADVVNAIAQGLATRGVGLNTGGEARVTVTDKGYALTLDGHAVLYPPTGMEAAEFAERMGGSASTQGERVVAKQAVADAPYTLREAKGAELKAEATGETVRFRHTIPLDNEAMTTVIADWRSAKSAPTFNADKKVTIEQQVQSAAKKTEKQASDADALDWRVSESDRESAQRAALQHTSARIKEAAFGSLKLGARSFDARSRMVARLPSASTFKERLCAEPPQYLNDACKSFNAAWSEREKALIAATKTRLKQAAKLEMKAVNTYISGQKRAVSKGDGLDISSETDPAEFAAEQCGNLSELEPTVCDKKAALFDKGLCGVVKGCQWKVSGPVKGIVAKLKAAEKRQERAEACAEDKCPDVGFCTMNIQRSYGSISWPRSCSYMFNHCTMRDTIALMDCFERRHTACRRRCGLRE